LSLIITLLNIAKLVRSCWKYGCNIHQRVPTIHYYFQQLLTSLAMFNNVIISDNCLPFFILYHYFLSSSTINCVNLRSDPEFKLIFTDAVLDFESITQHRVCYIFVFALPSLGLHNAHPFLALNISRKKIVSIMRMDFKKKLHVSFAGRI
jgi:hypothetical protein